MSFRQYNSTTRSSKNLFRERSLSSGFLPSKTMSVMNVISERQAVSFASSQTIARDDRRKEEQKSSILLREGQISKLRKNLQTAVSTAMHERLESSKVKEEILEYHHVKKHLEGRIHNYQQEVKEEQKMKEQVQIINEELKQTSAIVQRQNRNLQKQLKKQRKTIEQLQKVTEEIEPLQKQVRDMQPLKGRIIVLEQQNREQKLKRKEAEKKFKVIEKDKDKLEEQLSKVKPREQELQERIAYFERVNLDLERRMEDFNRRENDYIKQVTTYKLSLAKMTEDRNHFRTEFQKKSDALQVSQTECRGLKEEGRSKDSKITGLKADLEAEKRRVEGLKDQLQQKIDYFQRQGQENNYLVKRNKQLQEIEMQLRQAVQGYLRVSEEVNITIIQRTEEIRRQRDQIEDMDKQMKITEKRFDKFDKLMEDGSQKGYREIREGFYQVIRQNNELGIKVRQIKDQLDEKVLMFGDERDSLQRARDMREIPPPTDENQVEVIFKQKSEALLLYESSNDQLFKVKRDLEREIDELNKTLQKERKDMIALKIKTADLFRVKKDLDEARLTMQRYQEALEEDRQVIDDMKGQLAVLRQKNIELNDKFFMVDLDKRNLEVALQEMKEVMKELNVETLQAAKTINEKNSHLISDSLQKLDSAMKSMSFFFNCSFCGEAPLTPVTLATCGHNYCTKCKDAYAQFCYECDNGQPIERAFNNKFLKDALGKYKFLQMVIGQVQANFLKKQ